MRCVCSGFPYVLLSEVCVIIVRHTLPKQMLAGPRGKNSNQMRILPLFMTPDILISSGNFQLSCLPWLSHTIRLSLIHFSFPSHLILCFLYPVYFHVHPSFLDSDISLTLPLCSLLPECIITEIKLLLTWLSFRSLFLSLLAGNIHRGSHTSPPGKVWRPGAPWCCEPCCLRQPDTCYQPCRAAWGVSHRDPQQRAHTRCCHDQAWVLWH